MLNHDVLISTAPLIVITILAATAILAVYREAQRRATLLARQQERIEALEADLRALCSTGARVGERVVELEQDLRRALQWQSQLELRSPQAEPLRHAINLVERGAGVEDLVAACGLSRGEAELMARFRSRAA